MSILNKRVIAMFFDASIAFSLAQFSIDTFSAAAFSRESSLLVTALFLFVPIG